MNKIAMIVEMRKKVFTAQDLAVLWGYSDERKLYELIKYYVRQKEIFVLTRGLYSTNDYTEQELRSDPQLLMEIANRVVPNSYVSLFTVLREHGVASQYYDEVFSVASRSVVREVLGVEFVYKQMKEEVLLNDLGISRRDGVRKASLARAIGDTWYLYPKLNIEGLEQVSRTELRKMVKMYGKKTMDEKLAGISEEENVEY